MVRLSTRKAILKDRQVTTIPHLILFAPDGTILRRGLRGEQIHATVSELLGGK